jgi:hypothetical protein
MLLRNASNKFSSPLTPFSNTLSLSSSLNTRDQVLHSYKIEFEIIALCISVLAYLDKEDERFCKVRSVP